MQPRYQSFKNNLIYFTDPTKYEYISNYRWIEVLAQSSVNGIFYKMYNIYI